MLAFDAISIEGSGKYLWIFNGSREEKFLDRVGYLCASMIGVTVAAYENKIYGIAYRVGEGMLQIFYKICEILSICFTLGAMAKHTCDEPTSSIKHEPPVNNFLPLSQPTTPTTRLFGKAMKMCFVFL